MNNLPAAEPYSQPLYSQDRVAFNADWAAVLDPLHAELSTWLLTAPSGARTKLGGEGQVWVPEEHMRYRAEFVQLPEGQTAIFRRQSGVHIASATTPEENVELALLNLTREEVTASLVVSEAPDVAEIVGQHTEMFNNRIAADGFTRSRPVLFGLELVGNGSHHIVARTRRGLTPPPPLSALARNKIDVSPPAFFAVDDSASLPADANAMFPRMLGNTVIPRGGRVGLFWESYGINPGDSVKFTVNVIRAKNPNVFQRVAAALKFIDTPIGNIATAWQEPQRGISDSSSINRSVPILPRCIVLDLSQLSSGAYWIEITVNTPGKATAQAHSALTIRQRCKSCLI